MGVLTVTAIALVITVLGLSNDVEMTMSIQFPIKVGGKWAHTYDEYKRIRNHGEIIPGPLRERRPGGLSHETPDGREMEHRGIRLERQQFKYAKRLGKIILKFSNKLIKQAFSVGTSHSQGFVMSPLSIHMALSMASLGTRDATLKQFTKALGFRRSRFGKGGIHNAYYTLRNHIPAYGLSGTVHTSLGVFVKPRIPLEMTFRQSASQYYNGFLATEWEYSVGEYETQMKHFFFENDVSPKDVMTLTSALCFDYTWEKPGYSTKSAFATGGGTLREIYMLEKVALVRKIDVPHLQMERFQVILSEEESKEKFVLDIVPLNCTATVQDAVGVLTNRTLLKDLRRAPANLAHLTLPDFYIRNGLTSNEYKMLFRKLKLRKAFRRKANFQGISSAAGLYLQNFLHGTKIDVNRHGINCGIPIDDIVYSPFGPHPETHQFTEHPPRPSNDGLPSYKVDRLFVFALREIQFGTILTMGLFTGEREDSSSVIHLNRPIPLLSDAC